MNKCVYFFAFIYLLFTPKKALSGGCPGVPETVERCLDILQGCYRDMDHGRRTSAECAGCQTECERIREREREREKIEREARERNSRQKVTEQEMWAGENNPTNCAGCSRGEDSPTNKQEMLVVKIIKWGWRIVKWTFLLVISSMLLGFETSIEKNNYSLKERISFRIFCIFLACLLLFAPFERDLVRVPHQICTDFYSYEECEHYSAP